MSLVLDKLTKHFGPVTALDGISFEVGPGEVFGSLGDRVAGCQVDARRRDVVRAVLSPCLMLSRLGAGLAGPVDVIIAMVLLAITVPLALCSSPASTPPAS